MEFELRKVFSRLTEQGLQLEVSNEAKEFLIDKGYDLEFGARPLRRAIERYVEDPLSEDILRGEFKGKNLIKVSFKEDHLFFEGSTNVTFGYSFFMPVSSSSKSIAWAEVNSSSIRMVGGETP